MSIRAFLVAMDVVYYINTLSFGQVDLFIELVDFERIPFYCFLCKRL